ncbi:MAG: extracellular solute-binding protein, partial [Chloroflexota bacterium]|nr:extracellular solute-binding protein [Chloroflexota bacterium]
SMTMSPRRRTRRQLVLMGGAVALTTFGTACAGATGGSTAPPAQLKEPASLLYWSILGGADGTRMHDMTQRYVNETPLVKIEDTQGVPEFIQKFIASSVAGSPPDVVWIRQTYIPGFAEKSMLLDLQARELNSVGLRAEDFDPTVWKASEYKGKRYTVPIDIHGYQLIWNEPQALEGGVDPKKPPVTWQDWQEWATRLTQGDKFGATINFTGGGLLWQYQGFLRQAAKQAGSDADLFSADGRKANFNNAPGTAALTLMADIWKRAKHPLPTGPGNAALDLFERKSLASLVNGPWNLNRLADERGPAYNDVRVSFCPQRDPAKPSWWAQSHQVALAKPQKLEDNKRAAAFDFVRWLTEHTFEWSKAGQLPANKKVLASDEYQKSPLLVHKLLNVWEKNLPSAGFMQLHPRYVELEDQLPVILAKGLKNEVSVQESLTEAELLVNGLLGQ